MAPLITTRCSKFEIQEAMLRYGGGFVQNLARLWRSADKENERKIAEAWPNYITEYDEIAAKAPRESSDV